MQGGERIVGDLRLGMADARQEGRLAGIGQADQAGIGDQLEAQPEPALLARPARIGAARRAVGRGLEVRRCRARRRRPARSTMRWPISVRSATRVSLSSSRIWVPTGTLITRSSPGAGAVLAHAVLAALGLEMLLVAEVDQGVEAVQRLDHDIAAAAAVAAVGAAELDELLAPEARRSRCRRRPNCTIDLGLSRNFMAFPGGERGDGEEGSTRCRANRGAAGMKEARLGRANSISRALRGSARDLLEFLPVSPPPIT